MALWFLRGLTFEVTRDRRWGAWPARPMMKHTASRAKCPAAGPRVDRGVRPHWRTERGGSDLCSTLLAEKPNVSGDEDTKPNS